MRGLCFCRSKPDGTAPTDGEQVPYSGDAGDDEGPAHMDAEEPPQAAKPDLGTDATTNSIPPQEAVPYQDQQPPHTQAALHAHSQSLAPPSAFGRPIIET